MNLELSPEQEEFRKIVRAFAEEVVAPKAEAMDRAGRLDPAVLDQMADMGLFGLPFPEEVGGMGADYTTLCLAIEELARVDSSVAITLEAAVGLGAMPIWRYGNAEQHRRWLPPLAAGRQLAAFGLTEPGGGSDAGSLRTRATLDGDQWVIDGTKAFITNAGLDRSGLVVLAAATGLCQGCVDECTRYAWERQAFGRPIAGFQAIAFKIADMEVRAHTSRLAWLRAAAKLDAGQPFGREAAIAKLHASEAAVTSAREAVQVHGGYGYIEEFPVARFYRDAKILEIGEGTSEVMRILIARALGL